MLGDKRRRVRAAAREGGAVSTRSHNVPALDGIRGVGATLIFIVHLEMPAVLRARHPMLVQFKEAGWITVTMFFVLSAYLLTWLALREMTDTGAFSFGRYAVRRILRIWPMYFPVVLVGLSLWHWPALRPQVATAPDRALAYLTFTLNLTLPVRAAAGVGAASVVWTVAAEEQFYLFWGLTLRLCRRAPVRALGSLVAVLFALSAWHRVTDARPVAFLFYRCHPLNVLGSFAAGCALAVAERGRMGEPRLPGWMWWLVLGGFAAIAVTAYPFPQSAAARAAVTFGVDAWCVLLVALAARPSLATRLLGWRPIARMGELSYPFYLVHFLVIRSYAGARPRFAAWLPDPAVHPWRAFVCDAVPRFIATVALAELLDRLERPIQRVRRRLRWDAPGVRAGEAAIG
jgi:peptidoglycan/LPS O-acetylase OafA/YrhL